MRRKKKTRKRTPGEKRRMTGIMILEEVKSFSIGKQEEEVQLREQTEERRNQHANGVGTPSYISPSSKGPAHVPEEHKDFINRVM